MSDSASNLRKKMKNATELQSVVSAMKALAASSIGQYEKSMQALTDYYHTVAFGLGVCLRENGQASMLAAPPSQSAAGRVIHAVVFGSDQGLVGRFNDVIANHAIKALAALPGKQQVWAVGARVASRLSDAGLPLAGHFSVPNSIKAITPTIGDILVQSDLNSDGDVAGELHLFYNRPSEGSVYSPVSQRLLPLDDSWRQNLINQPWPGKNLPEVMGNTITTLHALVREYLFVSLFRACTESLMSENASRLAAMQRADKNINDMLDELNVKYHRLRQRGIDEELFDVISGFEALRADIDENEKTGN